MSSALGDRSVDELLDAIAADSLTPASGSVAGLVAAMAAALTAMAARRSTNVWAEAPGAVAQAEQLRRRAAPLAEATADAYAEAAGMLEEATGRDHELGLALSRAAEVPLLIAQLAADVAALAKDVAECGDPAVRADATAAALLAQAAARSAAHLVEINLGAGAEDLRVLSAQSLAAAASAWADAAVAAAH